MIELDEIEKVFILAIKRHFDIALRDPVLVDNPWNNYLKPLYLYFYNKLTYMTEEEYNYHLFKIVMDIYLKIGVDNSGGNHNLYSIFTAGFAKSWRYSEDTPIERVITQVCGLIQSTAVFDDQKGARFDLTLSEERKLELTKCFVKEIHERKEELYLQNLETREDFAPIDVRDFFQWYNKQAEKQISKDEISELVDLAFGELREREINFKQLLYFVNTLIDNFYESRELVKDYFKYKFNLKVEPIEDKTLGESEPSEKEEYSIPEERCEELVSQFQEHGIESGQYDEFTKEIDKQILEGAINLVTHEH